MQEILEVWLDDAINYITNIIKLHQYKKVVLQIPKNILKSSFELTQRLKFIHQETQFFVLYDSLKKSCCLNQLGAEHVAYDCLFHFGNACFSSPIKKHHYFIFESPSAEELSNLKKILLSDKIIEQINQFNINFILVEQKLYRPAWKIINQNHALKELQFLTLPFDADEKSQYLIFGYHTKMNQNKIKNLLIITSSQKSSENNFDLIENVYFSLKSLEKKIGQQLYSLNLLTNKIQKIQSNSKRLMQRYSLISQIAQKQVFGLLVSNTSTQFCQRYLQNCTRILKNSKKKYFLFMMNNLNEVKLGNFPEIEVYVIISCFNNSLFGIKDFHKLAITPVDLEIAFSLREFSNYSFDLRQNATGIQQHSENQQKSQEISETQEQAFHENKIQKIKDQSLMLQNQIQTLDFYKNREYKGLDFSQKKEIKKATKGKIGLAQKYTDLQ